MLCHKPRDVFFLVIYQILAYYSLMYPPPPPPPHKVAGYCQNRSKMDPLTVGAGVGWGVGSCMTECR